MFLLGTVIGVHGRDYVVQTPHTSLVLSVEEGRKPLLEYYGSRIDASQTDQLRAAGLALGKESYPVFGLIESMDKLGEKAMAVTHADGNMSLDLAAQSVRQATDAEGEVTVIEMKDRLYPFVLRQYFKAYSGTDVISTWVEAVNTGKKPVVLRKFASVMMPVMRGDNWLTHFHGFWGAEATMDEERLTQGTKAIRSNDALVNTESDNPSFMLTLDGRPRENAGRVIGGTLAWTGAYDIRVDVHKTFMYDLFHGGQGRREPRFPPLGTPLQTDGRQPDARHPAQQLGGCLFQGEPEGDGRDDGGIFRARRRTFRDGRRMVWQQVPA